MSMYPDERQGLSARWSALALGWKLALCGLGALVLISAWGDDGGGMVPPDVERGAVLSGLQLQGEKPLYSDDGIEVTDVAGSWVEVQFGADEDSRRWFNFDYVAAIKLKS